MWFPSLKRVSVSFLLAAAVAAPLVGAQPAAAFVISGPPDLTVLLSESPNPALVGSYLTYTVSVGNVSSEVCSRTYPEPICNQAGKAVSNVAVSMTIPSGASYYAGLGDHGFTCPYVVTGNSVTCSGGSLGVDSWGTVTIYLIAPTTTGVITATATVDPNNAIAERYETNNSASVSTTIYSNQKPDLVVTSLTGSYSAPRGGQASYSATIKNVGTATANNANVKFMGASDSWTYASASSSDGLAPCVQKLNELELDVQCPVSSSSGITLAPGQSASVTIVANVPTTQAVGNATMSATVDPYGLVSESNENNNTSTIWYTNIY